MKQRPLVNKDSNKFHEAESGEWMFVCLNVWFISFAETIFNLTSFSMNKFVYFPQHNATLRSTKHLECISWPKKHFFCLFGNNLKLARPNLYPLNCCIITFLPSTDSMLKQRQLLRINSWPFSFMDVSLVLLNWQIHIQTWLATQKSTIYCATRRNMYDVMNLLLADNL